MRGAVLLVLAACGGGGTDQYGESRFDYAAIGCTSLPCGMPAGWTVDESGCLGLMQIVPACGGTPNNIGLKADGHPNMTTDKASAEFASSIFLPATNIEVGVAGLAGNRDEVEMLTPAGPQQLREPRQREGLHAGQPAVSRLHAARVFRICDGSWLPGTCVPLRVLLELTGGR
jgi:hypothetical protein